MNPIEKKKQLFENTPVSKAILTLAIPTIISQLIAVVYNIADTFFIGRTGNPYMIAGVSLALPIFVITVPIGNLFGIGGGSLISRMMGSGNTDDAKRISAFSFYGALLASLIYSLAIFIFMDPILNVLGASENTLVFSRQYSLYVVVLGTIPIVLSSTISHLLRNAGYSTQAGVGLSGGGLLNIVLDPLFMFVLFPKGQEVLAAAVATLVSNVIAFIFLTIMLIRVSKNAPLSISPGHLRGFSGKDIRDTFNIGVPSALLPALFDVANVVMNNLMAGHGDLQLAAIGIVMKVERIPNAINVGISQGMMPLVAYNYSSGDHDRMRAIIKSARTMGIVIALICTGLLELFAGNLVGIFLDAGSAADAAAMTLTFAVTYLRFRATASLFQFLNYHSSFCLQAMGDGRDTLIHAFIRMVGLYIPGMFILNALFGENGLAIALTICEALADIVVIFFLRKVLRKDGKRD